MKSPVDVVDGEYRVHLPLIVLSMDENEGTADCGCVLTRGDDENPSVTLCAKHDAADDLLAALRATEEWFAKWSIDIGAAEEHILSVGVATAIRCVIRTAIAKAEGR